MDRPAIIFWILVWNRSAILCHCFLFFLRGLLSDHTPLGQKNAFLTVLSFSLFYQSYWYIYRQNALHARASLSAQGHKKKVLNIPILASSSARYSRMFTANSSINTVFLLTNTSRLSNVCSTQFWNKTMYNYWFSCNTF